MMYTKTVNNRQIFSDCKTIQMPNGVWVSNPSAEQIEEAGWTEYTPPVVTPQPQTEPGIEDILTAVKKMLATDASSLTDEEALGVAALYPTWSSKIGESVTMGERLWYDGRLWKVVQAHTVQEEWKPDTAVSLFSEVSIAEIPEWIQPLGAQDAYQSGDKVSHNGSTWISIVDNNTWEPGVYGWEES